MKKILLLIFLVLFIGIKPLFAQYPIPSFGVGVIHEAYFQEGFVPVKPSVNTDGKRNINVRISCPALDAGSCSATVWIYSLDGRDVLGPFRVGEGETLRVEIDERPWGALVICEEQVIVDVWIDELVGIPPGRQ